MMQKTVQSFKITNIRQLDHEGMVTETETPVTRQQIAKVLAETILGVDIEQFEDHWAGNLEIDISIFDVTDQENIDKPSGYFANVYKVETDENGMTHNGDCIADFDIELFTDRNDSRRLLECEGCGLIFTLGELEATAFVGESLEGEEGYFQEEIDDFHERISPGEVVPFGEHFWNPEIKITQFDSENYCGLIHEFDYSKLVEKPSLMQAIEKVLALSKADIYVDLPDNTDGHNYDEKASKDLQSFFDALAELERAIHGIDPVKPEPIKVLIYIEGGILQEAKVENGYDQGKPKVEIELWDIDNIGRHGRASEAKQAWDHDPGLYRPIEVDPCRFEQPAWSEAWNNWPDAAKIKFAGWDHPFTIINGVKIGSDNLQMMLMPNDEYINDEAKAIDDEFGYFVPFEIMMQGDKAVYDHIKAEIDDQFPGEQPA